VIAECAVEMAKVIGITVFGIAGLVLVAAILFGQR